MSKRTFAVVDPPRVIASPYLNTREAMAYLRLNDTGALYDLMKEQGLPYLRCGGRYRFDTRELDAWLRGTTALELRRAAK
jgi:excisionase family DNA binding protein